VARIATTRQQRILLDDAGASLAEVVDDDVSAESMGEVTALSQWREIEVELTGGDRRLLQAADAYLRKSGLRRSGRSAKLQRVLADRLPAAEPPPRLTPDAPAGQVVVAYLRAQADVLKSADPAVRRDEPDSVHQMRVTSRRLRSTLQAYPAVLESEATAHLQAELQWLGQVLGDARDGEVLAAHLEGLLDQLPPELLLGPVRATVTEHFAPRIAAARRAVLRQLDSRRYLALLDELDGLLADPPLTPAAADPASDVLPGQIAKAYRRLRRRIRHARSLPPGEARDAALHSARKAAKRTRYATEVMVAVAGRHAGRLVGRMKKIQSVLGGHQDAVIARATIRDLGLRAHQAGDNAFTFGLLYERDTHAALEFQERAFHVWHRAKRPKYRRWLRG
jgi:CHAD domain-containing protein